MNELDTGYSVKVGDPLIDAAKKATGSSVSIPCGVISDGSYLVTLEVNGSIIAYRESLEFSSGSCTVGAYTLSYSSYALTVSGTSNNDIVRVMVEPLEVKTTDAFRAAVKKDAPEAPNELPAVTDVDEGKVLTVNNSGVWGAQEPIGKKFIVTLTPTSLDYSGTMDKTVAEINAAYEAGQKIVFELAVTENTTIAAIATDYTRMQTGEGEETSYSAIYVHTALQAMIVIKTQTSGSNYNAYSYTLTPAT